jgi:lipopolysaccharide export LptBFGC system permease protein LptF
MHLTRQIHRSLADGKELVVTRHYLLRFHPNAQGFEIEGEWRSTDVEAPARLAALARARTTRQGRGTAMVGAIIAVVSVRVAGFGIAALAGTHDWAVVALYACPLAAIAAAAWYAFGDPEEAFARLRVRLPGRLRMAS